MPRVSLGLAIFTKIPAFTIIPLVAFSIYDVSRSFKILCIWLIPVVLVPCLWPLQSAVTDNFEDWLAGVTWQATGRPDKPLMEAMQVLLQNDPVLTVLGLVGMTFLLFSQAGFLSRPMDYSISCFHGTDRFCLLFSLYSSDTGLLHRGARLIVEMSKGFSRSRLVGHAIISLIAILE